MVNIPKIKVCGITRASDLSLLASAGVDSVGINVVSSSPRCATETLARELVEVANELGLTTVLITRNASASELHGLLQKLPVDFVQLHGSESPELADACGPTGIIKAISWSGRKEEVELANRWRATWSIDGASSAEAVTGPGLRAFLVDAYAPIEGGGTGKVARWDLLVPRPAEFVGVPLILAGGITAVNVREAIRMVQPDGIDTASGVEIAPGLKDSALVHAFASNAKAAFASVSPGSSSQ